MKSFTTIIHSNGSKWAGEEPDTVEKLLEVLGNYPLDRCFEIYGNFIQSSERPGWVRFFGNFATLSHVFRIDSDDPKVIRKLTDAILENKSRPDYLEQPSGREQEAERVRRFEENMKVIRSRGR